MKIDNNSDNRDAMVERVRKSYSLEDGSWYCPYCGNKNRKENEFLCSDCLRDRP